MKKSLEKYADATLESRKQQIQEAYDGARSHEMELAAEIKELEREIAQFQTAGGGPSSKFLSEKLEANKIQQVPGAQSCSWLMIVVVYVRV